MQVPLPWERSLWSAHAWWTPGRRYVLTDFRLVVLDGQHSDEVADEVALSDIREVLRSQSWLDRLAGTSTLTLLSRASRQRPVILTGVRHGAQLAAFLELLSTTPADSLDDEAVRSAIEWEPAETRNGLKVAALAFGAALFASIVIMAASSGTVSAISYPPDDAIYPDGKKHDREVIVRFMETSVMPWARTALAPIVGGEDRVTCATCHGSGAESRNWQMPSVARLPEPHFREVGWEAEAGGAGMDSQMRNAIYGYFAQADKQAKAGYMREVVMPGMARLLHRPAYDFTQSYEYNRTHFAFGCYHCHRVN